MKMGLCFIFISCVFTEQEKKLKKGKEEEKPDTITEKLVSHLVKNLLVRYPFNLAVSVVLF